MTTVSTCTPRVQSARPEPIRVGSIWRRAVNTPSGTYYETFRVVALTVVNVHLENVGDPGICALGVTPTRLLASYEHATDAAGRALENPARVETWRLDCLRSDANFGRRYDEEEAFRAIVKERETPKSKAI